jgi:hypothetical protein
VVGTVTDIHPSVLEQSLKRWSVSVQVEKVLSGQLSGTPLTFAVHSPARAGLAVGGSYTVRASWTETGYVVDEMQWRRPTIGDVKAAPGKSSVAMTSTRAGARVAFPKAQLDRAPRIVEGDGGYLDLVRSKDGHQLWVRRWWDDGSTDVTRFELRGEPSHQEVLQFVDGIVEPTSRDPGSADTSGSYEVHDRFRQGDAWFVQRLEAWVLNTDNGQIVRPATGQSYPVVPARRTGSPKTASAVQWTAFVKSCPETKSGCVYFGDPADVCGRYLDHTRQDTGRMLWIAPKKGCRGH